MLTLRKPTRILLAALALGLCADYLFFDRQTGISAALFVALGLATLAWLSAEEDRAPTRQNLWLAGAALFFALCLGWRASDTLTALNMLATMGLLALLATSYRGAGLARQPLDQTLVQLAAGLSDMAFRPAALAAHGAGQIRFERAQPARLRRVGCGLLLALPVLFVFTALLMSADTVFASYVEQLFDFQFPFDLADLIRHAIYIAALAWACAGGLLVALLGDSYSGFGRAFGAIARGMIGLVYLTPAEQVVEDLPAEGDTQRLRAPRQAPIRLGWVEALTVLVSVDLLFGSFMAIQGAYFFGGLDTLARTGMTYSEYARRGFFELLAVACLALSLLCALAVLTRRPEPRQRRAFDAACAAMIALVLGLLASAFQRMWLYEVAYGYTELRLYTHSFMIWLAVVLGLFLLALLRARPQLFSFGSLVATVAYLAVLNLANPDALIVRANVGRIGPPATGDQRYTSEQVDVYYLTQLSADAVPDLVESLPRLDAVSRQVAQDALSHQLLLLRQQREANGWPSWHFGRAAATWAIERAGIAATPEIR
jgi:hypothetical protein